MNMFIDAWFHMDECHLIMIDNEVVIVRENMMMKPKQFLNFYLRIHFDEQCQTIKKILS
jgi:hypothetical protein